MKTRIILLLLGFLSVTNLIYAQLKVNAGADNTFCIGSYAQLNATANEPVISYSWSPATGLSNSNIANPTANPTVATTYTVTVTGASGVVATDAVLVTPYVVTFSAGPDRDVCKGNAVKLVATPGSPLHSYTWVPATGLNDANIYDPHARPSTTTTYTVYYKDQAGCEASDQVTVNVRAVPVVNAGGNRSVCPGSSLTLTMTTDLPLNVSDHMKWTGPNVQTPSGSMSTVATPAGYSTYVAYYTAFYGTLGCTATDTVRIGTISTPTLNAVTKNMWISLSTVPGVNVTDYKWYKSINFGNSYSLHSYCNGDAQCFSTSTIYKFKWYTDVTYSYAGGSCVLRTNNIDAREAFGEASEEFTVYPVPAENTLTLTYNAGAYMSSVIITDVLGKTAYETQVSGGEYALDLSSLDAGIYVLKMTDENGEIKVKRIEVKR